MHSYPPTDNLNISNMELKPVWKNVLEKLKVKVAPETYETWFAQTQLVEIEDGIAKIGCKNPYIASMLEKNYHTMVKNMLRESADKKVDITFVVKPDLAGQTKSSDPSAPLFEEKDETPEINLTQVAKKQGLNPTYTFDRFVVGGSNRLAQAAAMAVAENPGEAYNPLFVYGGVGLGKTHLLHAIGLYALEQNAETKVMYVPTETLLNELVTGIRQQGMERFRNTYRELDILILDDVQFIAGRDTLQEEFFNTFNTLYQSGKQIVVASDRPPSEISKLEDRVRSRLEGGLVADIAAPDFEMRMAIINEKCEENEYPIPEAIRITIAEEVKHNIRELEGGLMTVVAIKSTGEQLTVEGVRKLLRKSKNLMKEKVKPEDVISTTSEYLGVTTNDLLSRRRTAEVALARQVVMYILREDLGLPLKEAAVAVKRTDHTTVIHAVEKIEKEMKDDDNLRQKIDEIRRTLTSHDAQPAS